MAKQYWIRVRGKQREEIDIELFAQALLMVIEDLQAAQQPQSPAIAPEPEDAS